MKRLRFIKFELDHAAVAAFKDGNVQMAMRLTDKAHKTGELLRKVKQEVKVKEGNWLKSL